MHTRCVLAHFTNRSLWPDRYQHKQARRSACATLCGELGSMAHFAVPFDRSHTGNRTKVAENCYAGRGNDKHTGLCANGRKVCIHNDGVPWAICFGWRIGDERNEGRQTAKIVPVRAIDTAEQ